MSVSELTRSGIVRCAESSDVPRMLEIGRKHMIGEGPYKDKIKDDAQSLTLFVGAVLSDKDARALVYEQDGVIQGMFLFTVFPHFYYFGGERTANEIIWVMEEKCRGRPSIRLLQEAKRQALEMGATRMLLTSARADVSKLYEHCGARWLETCYLMELS